MKEVNSYLIKEIKKMDGKIIIIGLDNEKILNSIEANPNIIECMSLNSTSYDNSKEGKAGRGKVLSVNKLRKKFKKKKHTNLIMNIEHIKDVLKTVIQDSIYITNKTIYIYGIKECVETNLLKKRYSKRYKTEIDCYEYKDSFVMKIDVTKAKNNKILDMFYYITDTIYNGIELLSDFLVN